MSLIIKLGVVPLIILYGIYYFWNYWNYSYSSIITDPLEFYDFIIVGAGTAGCVLANRLSIHYNVLLIEAGGFPNIWSSVPLIAPLLQKTSMDWQYETVPQAYSSGGLINNVSFWPRGKVLGGSGQINYLTHYDGREEDFESWGPWFNYENITMFKSHVLGYETKLNYAQNNVENFPVRVSLFDKVTPVLAKAIITSKYYLSKLYKDVRIFVPYATTYKGSRFSSLNGYLYPIMNRNSLHILLDSLVTKIIFDQFKTAVGVQLTDGRIIKSRKEVILAAGALESPKLLLLSGIGPRNLLEKHYIPIISENSEVGSNLFDHLSTPLYISADTKSISFKNSFTLSNIYNYITNGEGTFNFSTVTGLGSINNKYGFLACAIKPDQGGLFQQIANYKNEAFTSVFPMSEREGFVFLTHCLKPKSRGTVEISSANPLSSLLIDPKYFLNEEDIKCGVEAVKIAIEILQTKSFHSLSPDIHLPKLKQCEHLETSIKNDDYLACIVRHISITTYHPGGTCAIGEKKVVDYELRVLGVKKLRIVDGSVFPEPIAGTPNTLTIIVAEIASRIIINSHLFSP